MNPCMQKENKTETKESGLYHKCDIYESDFVMQAITYFNQVSG